MLIASVVEQSMNSVERMRYYTAAPTDADDAGDSNHSGGIPVEAARYSSAIKNAQSRLAYNPASTAQLYQADTTPPPSSWPSKGAINFQQLGVTYNPDGVVHPDDLVLSKISASIGSLQRVGVVGRTGSGKSTLLTSLFRLVEAAEGGIEIDADELGGRSIAEIGLSELRSRLAIVPQVLHLVAPLHSCCHKFAAPSFGQFNGLSMHNVY